MPEGCLTHIEDNRLKPLPRFTPLKHCTAQGSLSGAVEESLTSSSYSPSEDSWFPRRQVNIVDLKTPQFKTQPVHLPDASDRVLTSLECRKKIQEKQRNKEALLHAKELRKQQKQLKKDSKNVSKCKLIYYAQAL